MVNQLETPCRQICEAKKKTKFYSDLQIKSVSLSADSRCGWSAPEVQSTSGEGQEKSDFFWNGGVFIAQRSTTRLGFEHSGRVASSGISFLNRSLQNP